MKDRNALVEALARSLREVPGAEDPRWDALAAGRLSPEETEALLRDAAAEPTSEDARAEAMIEEALAARQAPAPAPAPAPEPTPAPASAPAPPPAPAPAPITRPRARLLSWTRARAALALAAALAILALAALLVLRGDAPRAPPLLALDARGDARSLAPDPEPGAGELIVSPGTRVRLSLSPGAPVDEDLVARLFVVSGGAARALPVRPAPGRALHVEGLREELFADIPAGRHELVVLVAFAGTPGDDEALAAMARDEGHALPGWRAVRRALTLRAGTTGALDAVPPEVHEAAELRARGLFEEAGKKLASAPDGLPKRRLAARLELSLGHTGEAARQLREVIEAGRAAGDAAGAGNDVLALAYMLLQIERDAAGAEQLVEAQSSVLAQWPEGAADALYVRGQIAQARGDLRAALARYGAAAEEAERLGRRVTRDGANDLRADVLATLGRHAEALALARSLPLPDEPGCDAGQSRNNVAWIELRAARAGAGGDAARAVALLGEALGFVRAHCPYDTGEVLTNLAVALLEDGDPIAATLAAGAAEREESPPKPVDAMWWALVRGEAEIAAGRAAAARPWFDHAREIGAQHSLKEAAFEGALGEALSWASLDREAEARRAFEDAGRALDAWARAAPLGEGRGQFLSEHARSARLSAAFFERRGRPGEALGALRRGAARYYALLDAPESGPLTDPPPPADGAALLAAAELPEGLTVFAARGERAASARAADLTPSGLGAAVAPLADLLRGAARLRVPAGGALRHADVHAALLDGRPLAARLPVEYALDLPPLAPPPRPSAPVALLVADPQEDLPSVRGALPAITAALGAQGYSVRVLRGPGATLEALRAELAAPDVYLLGYAGHASFAGLDGLDAALLLADGAFTVRDVLALPRAPPYAVLLGCSSARTDPAADSLGVAQAFLVKGSLSVVASRAELDAEVVERLGARLVSDLGAPPDLPAVLARAQAALASESPAVSWPVLRALVR